MVRSNGAERAGTVAENPAPQELNARILRPLLWYAQERLGIEVTREVHRQARVPIEVFQEDSGWLSHEAFERLIVAYRNAIGTTAQFAEACVYDNRRAYGPLLVVFPFLTGRQAYEVLGRTIQLVSRISRYEVEVRSGRDLTLRYFTQRAESRLMCLTRRAQLPMLPILVGLPQAEVEERSCVARGDPCCTYRVRIRQQNRWAALAVGAGLGLLVAFLVPRAMMSPAIALSLLPAAGLAGGALADLGRRILAQRRLLLEARRQSDLGATTGLRVHDSSQDSNTDTSAEDGPPPNVDRDAATLTTRLAGSSDLAAPRTKGQTMPGPGIEVGRYEVLNRAGKGGMGTVFAARDTKLGRRVALKLLHRYRQPADAVLARLVREGQALATLAHPNVVTVYDVGEWEDTLFLVMEFVEGSTLKEWASGTTRPSIQETLALLLQAAEGLSAAHGAGLIHRDFKPSNVLVGEDGRVRVADFGLAQRAESERQTFLEQTASSDELEPFPDDPLPAGSTSDATESGQVTGTPRYMAPEQYEGRRLDPRCDQFSFCVVAYELLCGVHPFAAHTGGDYYAAAKAAVRAAPQREVPQALLDALSRGMAPNRPRRFASMRELIDALRETTPERPRSSRLWFLRRRRT